MVLTRKDVIMGKVTDWSSFHATKSTQKWDEFI